MAKPAFSTVDKEPLSHNLLGQRLGRKGRDTRERILAATERLLAGPPDTAISLSGVAREASLAMTTLYLYFGDLTELLVAVLEPIMASAEDAFVAHLRRRWPDEQLGEHCLRFLSKPITTSGSAIPEFCIFATTLRTTTTSACACIGYPPRNP